MPRISRLTGLRSLQSAIAPAHRGSSFAVASRSISTSQPAAGRNTDWVRGKLWKGEAPGPEDPYTQRLEVEQTSNLPNEALEERWSGDLVQSAARNSQLAFPPKRTEATMEKDAQAVDPNYTPATTIEELEEIGPLSTWWEQPGHWSEQNQFKGWAPTAKITDKDVLEVYVRRAVVEVLALKQAGQFSEWATKTWRVGTREDLEAAVLSPITVKDGVPQLGYIISTRSITSPDRSADLTEHISPEEAKRLTKKLNPSWKTIALDDEFKFVLRKRLYQLTGNLIPDAKLGAARTPQHVVTLASKQPAPVKLAETLAQRSGLPLLPNVSLHSRRITPIDKEIAVGRWKIIEEELKKRDLPVTGTAGLKKNKEMDWVLGNE